MGCPITVLVVDAEPKVTLDEAEAWREHTEAVADVRVFSGGHFFMTNARTRCSRSLRADRFDDPRQAAGPDRDALGAGVHIVTAVRDWA